VYDADIAKCFDRIDHSALLDLCTVFDKGPVKQWLKAGIYDPDKSTIIHTKSGLFYELNENIIGTPQGGVISPILSNVALNGLESAIIILDAPRQLSRSNPNNKVHLVRYADDFVIVAPHKSALELRIKIAEEFLQSRGLELSLEKSKIMTIYEGFDYLGFNIRKYKVKYTIQRTPKHNTRIKDELQNKGYTLLITPSANKVKGFKRRINQIFAKKRHKGATKKRYQFLSLIEELNPVILG
jgi:RNA-directed DNA polymerase